MQAQDLLQARWIKAMDNLKTWHEQHECRPENLAKWGKVHDEVAFWISQHAKIGDLLDVGCRRGDLGRSSLFPASVNYFGIDPVQVSGFKYEFPFRCETLESTSLGDESFDFLVIKDSIDYFMDPEASLLSAFRVLKKGGYLLISEGGHQHGARHEVTSPLRSTVRLLKRGGRKLLREGPSSLLFSVSRRLQRVHRSKHMLPLNVDVLDTYPNGDLSASYILDCCERAGFREVKSSIEGHRLFVSAIR